MSKYFDISKPLTWTQFGEVKDMKVDGKIITFSNGKETITVDFGNTVEIVETPKIITGKTVRNMKRTHVERITNDDKSRTVTQNWQLLFDDGVDTKFVTRETFPQYHTTDGRLVPTIS